MNPVGQVKYFCSRFDNTLQPHAVCATDTSKEPKLLVLEVSPGAITDLAVASRTTERLYSLSSHSLGTWSTTSPSTKESRRMPSLGAGTSRYSSSSTTWSTPV